MKMEEILAKSNYKNSFVTVLNTDDKNIEESQSTDTSRVKIKDYSHFLEVMSNISNKENNTIVLEDNNQKYIINGDFAQKVS